MNDLNILSSSLEKIKAYILANSDTSTKILDYQTPSALSKVIPFDIAQKGVSENEFLDLLDKYLEYSVKTGNKQFLNQLYAGFNLPAFIGEVFSVLTNTSMYTYEVAPVATCIETEMIRLMNSYTGYTKGDGIFLSGGSNANLIAMFSARNRLLPDSRIEGYNCNEKLKAFVNENAHYSFGTAANLLGIGTKNLVKVKADNEGRMLPAALEKAIRQAIDQGEKPFFVAATCATTMMGAYDPIDAIADVTEKYGLWLHADGAFGGSLLLSEKHRHLMQGIERSDSFTWDPHKLMNIPLICSALLVKKAGTLQKNITDINTDYIYHDIDEMDDLGKKSIQCGRRVDAVKLWFAWKYFGLEGYRDRIDNLINMAEYVEEIVKSHPQLRLHSKRQSFAVCFQYIPKKKTNVNDFNLAVREALRKTGKSNVNFGYNGSDLVIRFVAANADLNKADIDRFFTYFISEAQKLENA
ncbi:MAG: aminotransferase class I/II-fold pyridoxal phosphate-dependent enzyme [Bacteroidales bacterium]|nr:aminotransferase class I/II-fold pyridoxal phosphate-dependent enzyme [Bacteroidales bacterium]MDD4430465.1 aminotransferase class I/II-fold pyridoxal phosphate-dependent enzyme [Bacteroidales bacterium]